MPLNALAQEFSTLPSWEERYTHLISLASAIPPLAPELKIDANKVSGCMSQVWMSIDWNAADQIRIYAESDSKIVNGLICILLRVFDGKSAAQILYIDVEKIFDALGFENHISPNRRNGFFLLYERVKESALEKAA